MGYDPGQSVSAAHRRFTSPDEWLHTIQSHFSGSRYARRGKSFSVRARLEKLAGMSLLDVCVNRSGLEDVGDNSYGLSIEAVEAGPYFVIWQQTGVARVRQAGRAVELRAGEWALFDACIPTSFLIPDDSRTLGMSLPYARCDWARRVHPGGARLHRSAESTIASALILEALRCSDWVTPQLQSSLETVLIDAVEACLSQPIDLERGRLTRANAKLDRARQAIEAQIANTELRPEDIGRAIGLSRRSLYRLFQQIGQTPMECIHGLRLAEAARRLRDGAGDDPSVTGISYAVGFADPSHFGRLFRARYGMSPRQWIASRSDL